MARPLIMVVLPAHRRRLRGDMGHTTITRKGDPLNRDTTRRCRSGTYHQFRFLCYVHSECLYTPFHLHLIMHVLLLSIHTVSIDVHQMHGCCNPK